MQGKNGSGPERQYARIKMYGTGRWHLTDVRGHAVDGVVCTHRRDGRVYWRDGGADSLFTTTHTKKGRYYTSPTEENKNKKNRTITHSARGRRRPF
jgi:hypothetical protein